MSFNLDSAKQQIIKDMTNQGYSVIKGVPLEEDNETFLGLARMIGTTIAHNSKVKETVREITPRDGAMPLENYPHTDSPHWPNPNDAIVLQCKLEDQHRDVFSRIVLIDDVLEEFHDSPTFVTKLREKKIPFILSPDFGSKGVQFQPILTKDKYHDHVRFCRVDTINCVKDNLAVMDSDELQELEEFEKTVDKIGKKTQFAFNKGDVLIFDNKRVFHSKTETSPDTVRTLKKIKLQFDRDLLFND